ncbi:MAG: TonB-dependent receptor [Pseudomonadota bacterium]|nr:TonB-dependent receptor [Pseudomonadota bacterium]
MKNLNLLALSVKTALFAGAITSFGAVAAEEDNKAKGEEEIEKVVVTGSRIKRIDLEGPSPVVTISADDMEDSGFNNVYDALQNLSFATGQVIGEQSANSSQTAGQAINLRGLGPGSALTLINGRRVTDNPTASYNGGSFFDFSLIPMAAVERIEVMTGGASAIYGSDAVAGVINVILKDSVEDQYVSYEYGQATEGGRETNKIQFVGGYNTDKLSLTGIFEYQDQEGLFASDKSELDDISDDPNGAFGREPVQAWFYNRLAGQFFPTTDADCEIATPGSKAYDYFKDDPDFGKFCGDTASDEYTLANPRERMNLIATMKYDLSDDHELFGTVVGWKSKTNNQIFRKWLQYVGPTPDGQNINALRSFDYNDIEPGNYNDKETFVVSGGARGLIFEDYDYEFGVNFSRSNEFDKGKQFKTIAEQEWMEATNYNPFNEFNSSQFSEDAIGYRWEDATSKSLTVDFSVSGDLWELPAGMVQFATIFEYQHNEYEIIVDEIARQGQDVEGGWTNGSADFGAGQRDRYSVGAEFSVPLHETLNLTAAARYDDYHDKSSVGGRPTTQLSLTYRPMDEIMLRASASESFRAPDMHFLFRERQDAFYSAGSLNDSYGCRLSGDYPDCINWSTDYSSRYLGQGNPELKEEDGRSYNLGVVVEPIENMSISLDYYDIRLENRVVEQTGETVLYNEANCRLGSDPRGEQTYDINSQECQRALAQVERDEVADGELVGDIIRVKPTYINQAAMRQTGWDVSARYSYRTDDLGSFNFRLGYTLVTKYEEKEVDEWRSIRDSVREPRSNMNVQLGWNYEDFGATLTIFRKGGILRDDCFRGFDDDGNPTYNDNAECNNTYEDENGVQQDVYERLDPYYTANINTFWRINDHHELNFSVSNITDELGQEDQTEGSWPWRNDAVYNLMGRYAAIKYSYYF